MEWEGGGVIIKTEDCDYEHIVSVWTFLYKKLPSSSGTYIYFVGEKPLTAVFSIFQGCLAYIQGAQITVGSHH